MVTKKQIIRKNISKMVVKTIFLCYYRLCNIDLQTRGENMAFNKSQKQAASVVVGNSTIIVNLAGLINVEEEVARQNKKLEKIMKEKTSLEAKINNQKFIDNAPKDVVEKTQERINELNIQKELIDELIISLKG